MDNDVECDLDDVEIEDNNLVDNNSSNNVNVNNETKCEPPLPDVKTSRYGRKIVAPKRLDL